MDGVGVVLAADIDPDGKTLDANPRRPVELEPQQAGAEYSLISATPASSPARFVLRPRRVEVEVLAADSSISCLFSYVAALPWLLPGGSGWRRHFGELPYGRHESGQELAERAPTSANDTEPLWIRDERLRMRPGGRGINALCSSFCGIRVCRPPWHGLCPRGGHEATRDVAPHARILILVTLSTSSSSRAEDADRTQSFSFATGPPRTE